MDVNALLLPPVVGKTSELNLEEAGGENPLQKEKAVSGAVNA